MKFKTLGIFVLTFAGSMTVFAQSGFKCGSVQEMNPSSFAKSLLKIDLAEHCERDIPDQSKFDNDKIAVSFLGYINGASQKKLIVEGVVAQNGYQKKFETFRSDKVGADTIQIKAVEEVLSYPQLVVYKNDTTSIQATGIAGQVKETHVTTQVSLKQRASGAWYVAFDTRTIGIIEKPFFLPSGPFQSLVISTSKKELGTRAAETLSEIAKTL